MKMIIKKKREVCSKQNNNAGRNTINDARLQLKNSYTQWLNSRQAEKRIRCDVCKKIFAEKDIWSHVEIHIGDSKVKPDDYEISSGGEAKCQPSDVNTTQIQVRSSIRNSEDNNISARGSSLRHSRKVAKSIPISAPVEKPFTCDICQKYFRRKSYLHTHMNIHMGKKPFKCVACQAAFTHKSSWIRHSLIHRDVGGFVCDICKRSFRRKDSFKSHIDRKHFKSSDPTKKRKLVKMSKPK